MARLIEVQDVSTCASPLKVQVGDVLLFHATGCHVRLGRDVVEPLGPLVTAVLGDNGNILTPIGPPNIVMFRAKGPGEAKVELVTGDPFRAPVTTGLHITVE
jgi:hypothetical protein